MSYDLWTRITLNCDAPGCARQYQGMGGCSVMETRKQAKPGGWTYEKGHPSVARGSDYCPDHGKKAA